MRLTELLQQNNALMLAIKLASFMCVLGLERTERTPIEYILMSTLRTKENDAVFSTVDDFKLTCTTTHVKRGIDVPLLSECVQHAGGNVSGDKRFFLKMA